MVSYFEGSGSLTSTELFALHNHVQATQIFYPKQLIIGTIRDILSQDSTYHYVSDPFGYPNTPNVTDLPSDAGVNDDATTRVWVGEAYRFDVIFYPAIVIKNAGSTYVPLSINRDKETILYGTTLVSDGYGNLKNYNTPLATIEAGIWEGSITVTVMTRDIRSRDDLVEIISSIFTSWRWEELRVAGVLIKRVSVGAPTEGEDRADKLYSQTITLETRAEWRIQTPIDSVIDLINFCVDFGHDNAQTGNFDIAPNLEIVTSISLLDSINDL